MYASKCDKCHIRFICRQLDRRSDTPWSIFYQSFRFQNDKTYHSLSTELDEGKTIVWLHNPNGDPMMQVAIKIDGIFPVNKPEDALPLARRLHNLVAFI